MMMRKLLLPLVISSITMTCHAAKTPASAGFDKRVQQIVYNPNDVTIVKTKAGKLPLLSLKRGKSSRAKILALLLVILKPGIRLSGVTPYFCGPKQPNLIPISQL
ncbi:P-type conjugative transfer protein VirB9 [Escherichia coli]|uniref:P-type conjugative transfer protein VirB9 n=1 Tax=Escherichia coli TaxID=562 RepID=A0A376YIN4_ECOLX|nr:P-type conjugative transfer protein VirB9 [Escherichia coli]